MKDIKYYHDKSNNQIFFTQKIPKGRNNIKVYFYRNRDETKLSDYPIATCDGGIDTVSWIDGFEILTIHIRIRKWFKSKWIVIEKL